jgi:hypothetical protein
MNAKRLTAEILCLSLVLALSGCVPGLLLSPTLTPTSTFTTTYTNIPTSTFTPQPTNTSRPTRTPYPTSTPNLYQFNGYWLSPIEANTGAYIQTYQNDCPEYLNGTDKSCIENYMGEKGTYPKDFWDILVCPSHIQGMDIAWDHQGVKIYAVQGGQIIGITLENNSTIGVHFFIIDKKPNGWFAADYGHINLHSLVDNAIITQEQVKLILLGQQVDGSVVREGQLLGITGDDCCPFGVLHIGAAYGLDSTDPADLWKLGTFPDILDSRPRRDGINCAP